MPLDTDRFQVIITPDEVIIANKKAGKPDAGDYNIKLKNEKGEDSLPVKVKILGPPESPKGPLEVSDIKADSCTLRWRPPTVCPFALSTYVFCSVISGLTPR